jgi:uncharacterized membrane protein YeaQ/YmgE (transglycosylase-associated protein family)
MENGGVSGQNVIVWVIIGTIVGVLAWIVVKKGPLDGVGDIIAGIVGAFVGGLLLSRIGFEIGLGFDPVVIDALVGSLVLLTLVRILTRKNRGG